MPRVKIVRTRARRKSEQPFICSACTKPIAVGEQRYTWSFRYGGTYNRHVGCGHPRQSELTQGQVGELYAAQEAIEDALDGDRSDFESWRDAVADALADAATTANDLAEVYREAAEHFGGEGENAERADACEEWASTLESAESDVRGVEPRDADPIDEDDAEGESPEFDEVSDFANDACGELGL